MLDAIHHLLAGEGDDRLEVGVGLLQLFADGLEVADGALDVACHHHAACLTFQELRLHHMIHEVVHHQRGLGADGLLVGFHIGAELLLRFGALELRIVLNGLLHLVVALVGRVVGQHVQDKILLDGLLHGIQVMRIKAAVSVRLAELLQRRRLRRGSEGKEGGVLAHLALAHGFQHQVLPVFGHFVVRGSDGLIQAVCRASSLRTVGFINDDREALATEVGHAFHNPGKLLDRGGDELLALLQMAAQVGGAFGVGDEVLHLGELLDVPVDLLVQHAAVGDHDHGVEEVRLPGALVEFDELIGQPGDAVTLAGARAVLDQVATAHAFALHQTQELPHHLELMVAREVKDGAGLLRLFVHFLHHLGEVLDDVAQALPGEDIRPEVGRLRAIGVRRVAFAGPVRLALVEGQEVSARAIHLRGYPDLIGIDGKVDEAAAEVEERLVRVAVLTILLLRVVHVLAGPRVLEFQRRQGQTVDEEHHVHRLQRIRQRVMHLPGHGEPIALKLRLHLRVQVVVGQTVKQIEVRIVHLQALLQHGQDTVLLQLTVQALQHLPLPVRLVVQLRQFLRLRALQELPQHRLIHRELRVEVPRLPALPAIAAVVGCRLLQPCVLRCHRHDAGQSAFNAGFQGGFVGLGGHDLALGMFEHGDFDVVGFDLELSRPVAILSQKCLGFRNASSVAVGIFHHHQHLGEHGVSVVGDMGKVLLAGLSVEPPGVLNLDAILK